jgi:LuxR family maltose regulon positive regulatory protein
MEILPPIQIYTFDSFVIYAMTPKREQGPARICTLGRLALAVNDEPLVLQQKPLELLRALIVLGGANVPVVQLAQTLRPGTAANVANHALDTNLYRLRKALGDPCIRLRGGMMSLNPEYCWLDVWELERLLAQSEDAMLSGTTIRRTLDLYRGPFLRGDESPSVLVQRERLDSKFLRMVMRFGQVLESRAEYQVAIDCYRRAIEANPLAEELYRRLMHCHYELKQPAEALAVYMRCCKALKSVLGIEPTLQTMSLYRKIRGFRA